MNAWFFQTWKTLLFINETSANVTALQNFVTTFCNFSNTIWFTTTVFKCLNLCLILFFYFYCTKSTFSSILIIFGFLTSHTYMIWCSSTTSTKVLITIWTANSEICHVICSMLWNYLTSVIFLFVIWFWRFKHDNTRTVAPNKSIIEFNSFVHLIILNLWVFFTSKNFFCFIQINFF